MTRYQGGKNRSYEYRCAACGTSVPDFQGLYWFATDEPRGDATVEVPYCPECGAAALRVRRVEPER